MVIKNTHVKKRNNCYGVINRSKGWKQLYHLMSRKNILDKINSDIWSELSLEQKRSLLRNVKDEYVAYLRSIGMEKSIIVNTKSYLLLNTICNFKTKTISNQKSVKTSWDNLRMCALSHN